MNDLSSVKLVNLKPSLQPSPTVLGDAMSLLAALPSMDYLLMAARLGELYEEIFPNHLEWLGETAAWKNEEEIGASVTRFLERVSKLFPIIPECANLELDSIQAELEYIPITPMGFDIWYDAWDQYHEPIPYLLYLMHARHLTKESAKQSEFERLYPDYQVPKRLKLDGLLRILENSNLPAPLKGLPDLIRMLNGWTNNLWLDLGYIEYIENQGEGLCWDADEVEFLTREWQEAEPIYEQVQALLNWKNETDVAKKEKLTAVHQSLLDANHVLALNQQEEKAARCVI